MASTPIRPRRARLRFARASLREAAALLSMLALIAGLTLAGQQSGSAATPVAQSNGTFLSGAALGVPLSDIVSFTPAGATNTGGAAVVDTHPLDVTALNAVNVPLGGGVNLLGGSGILQLGAVAQYAQADPDGSSRAASGAVTDSGAIAVDGSDEFPADATLQLSQLIGPALSAALANVSLSTGALSATATQTAAGTQTGRYQIAGLKLDVTSPLVAGITSGLRSALAALQPTVNALPALIRALPGVGPLATITGVPNLTTIVDQLGAITSADGSITANLATGAISIDVAKVLTTAGLALNALPPATELLPYVTNALTTQLLPAITTALTGLTTQLTAAVNGISVTVLGVPVALAVLAPVLSPVIAQLVAPVNTVVAGLGNNVITPLANALTNLLSLQANVQQTSGGAFTERALRVGLLPSAATPAAVVNLASATVGPNAGPAAPVAPTATALTPDHGPAAGGDTVTITGTGFVPGSTSVTIGGVTIPAGSVTVISPTELTFPTPAHPAGNVSVTVTTAGGTSNPALTYTYDPAAPVAPTATGLTPDHGPTAGGDTVTITGTGFVPGSTSVTIGGVTIPAGSVTVASPTTLTFATPGHAPGQVPVIVTTGGGSSSSLTYTYDQPATTTPPTTTPPTTTPPTKTPPTTTQPAKTPPTITEPTDGSTTTDTTPIIRGTGTPGDRITVIENGRTLCTATVAADGSWTCRSGALSASEHRIVTIEYTPAGDTVGRSQFRDFAVNAVSATSDNDSDLATTGLAIASTTLLALVLAAAGFLLVITGRRRHET